MKYLKLKYNSLVALLILIVGCQTNSAQVQSKSYNIMLKTLLSHSVEEISVAQASELKDVIFIDARELSEYNVSHIKDAVWVGYNNFDSTGLSKISTDEPVVVYCSVGYRSEKISEKIKAMGYSNVSNLYGGIFEWVNQGHPVVTVEDQPTKKVHAFDKTWGIWLKEGEKVYD